MLFKWPQTGDLFHVWDQLGNSVLWPEQAISREDTYSFFPLGIVHERLPTGDELCPIFQFLDFSALNDLLFP